MEALSEFSREQLTLRMTECYDPCSSIEEKIGLARDLHSRWAEPLRVYLETAGLLERLAGCIEATWETMRKLGLVDICRHCDEQEGGSCCGAGIEHKFDVLLLLMNLLLGVSLPEQHRRPESCLFLATTGCILKVRLVLCVDFLCPRILGCLSHQQLVRLQEISGEELLAGFRVYDAIKRFLRGHGWRQGG